MRIIPLEVLERRRVFGCELVVARWESFMSGWLGVRWSAGVDWLSVNDSCLTLSLGEVSGLRVWVYISRRPQASPCPLPPGSQTLCPLEPSSFGIVAYWYHRLWILSRIWFSPGVIVRGREIIPALFSGWHINRTQGWHLERVDENQRCRIEWLRINTK